MSNTSKQNPFYGLPLSSRSSTPSKIEHNNGSQRASNTAQMNTHGRNHKRRRSTCTSSESATTNNKPPKIGSTTAARSQMKIIKKSQLGKGSQRCFSAKTSNENSVNDASLPQQYQFHPFPKLPFDIRHLIWKEAMGHTRVIGLDEFEKFHKTLQPQEPTKECGRCRLVLPGLAIPASREYRLEITELLFCSEPREEATRSLQENKRVKSILEKAEEILFVPDLMKWNGLGWARLTKLSPFARQNIRSIALYVSSNNVQRVESSHFRIDDHKTLVEYLAGKLQETLQNLENIYLVIDVERKFRSTPPPTKVWRFIPGCTPARFQGSLKERNAWAGAYAEGHHVKDRLYKYLEYTAREHHKKYCGRGNGTSAQIGVSPSSEFIPENTAREIKAKVDIKIVEWGN